MSPRAELREPVRSAAAGYSLLELVITLAIIGLIVTLAAPPFIRMWEQQRRFDVQQRAEAGLAGMYLKARAMGQDVVIRTQEPGAQVAAIPGWMSPLVSPVDLALPDTPPGWTLRLDQDVFVRYDGVCSGGRVSLRQGGELVATYDLRRPDCAPIRSDATATP